MGKEKTKNIAIKEDLHDKIKKITVDRHSTIQKEIEKVLEKEFGRK